MAGSTGRTGSRGKSKPSVCESQTTYMHIFFRSSRATLPDFWSVIVYDNQTRSMLSALVRLMRHSGLVIVDAATLCRDDLIDHVAAAEHIRRALAHTENQCRGDLARFQKLTFHFLLLGSFSELRFSKP
jgi:hypothetical protein